MQTVALSLFRFDRLTDRLWVLAQMALARPALGRLQGLSFARLCGSGTGEGFTPRPNPAVWAILTAWDEGARAREAVAFAAPFTRWRARACEAMTLFLEPYSARGAWGGRAPFEPHGGPRGAVAALTRASVRPGKALRFWGRVPDISARIGQDANVAFKIGIGEVPFLHQVTFSVWPDAARMAQFARTGPHAEAIAAVRAGNWFSEELYARFRVTGVAGTWEGINPLDRLELAA
jgi:spheroidene monooxygenase